VIKVTKKVLKSEELPLENSEGKTQSEKLTLRKSEGDRDRTIHVKRVVESEKLPLENSECKTQSEKLTLRIPEGTSEIEKLNTQLKKQKTPPLTKEMFYLFIDAFLLHEQKSAKLKFLGLILKKTELGEEEVEITNSDFKNEGIDFRALSDLKSYFKEYDIIDVTMRKNHNNRNAYFFSVNVEKLLSIKSL
jgi:hypothetical protein